MLRTKIGQGIILLPGNAPAPNNYPNNAYYFRQDSSFLYYFGLNIPSLVGLIDADSGEEALYGDDFTVEDIIWTGPQPTLRELGAQVGVTETFPTADLEARLRKAIAQGRKIHYLPPYRGETKLQLSELLGINPALLHDYKSVDLMFAVAEMREKEERRGDRGDGARLPHRLRNAHAGHEALPPGHRRARDRRCDRRRRQVARVGALLPVDRLAARRNAPQPQLRRGARGGPAAALRRRRRDGEQLLLGPHPHLSRQRTLHRAAEGDLQHRAGGPRPRGPHHQAPHDVYRDPQGRLPHAGRRADRRGTDQGLGGRRRGLGRHDDVHAPRTGPRAGHGRARLRGDGRAFVRLLDDCRACRQVGHLHLPRGLAHRAGHGADRRAGSLLHPGADRQVPRRGSLQGGSWTTTPWRPTATSAASASRTTSS